MLMQNDKKGILKRRLSQKHADNADCHDFRRFNK